VLKLMTLSVGQPQSQVFSTGGPSGCESLVTMMVLEHVGGGSDTFWSCSNWCPHCWHLNS